MWANITDEMWERAKVGKLTTADRAELHKDIDYHRGHLLPQRKSVEDILLLNTAARKRGSNARR
jgi:hypothetical protein